MSAIQWEVSRDEFLDKFRARKWKVGHGHRGRRSCISRIDFKKLDATYREEHKTKRGTLLSPSTDVRHLSPSAKASPLRP
jgi:hypothetical protein